MRATTASPRKLISVLALLGLLALAVPAIAPRPAVAATGNPITIENQQPGTTDWALGGLVADDVNQQIKGYASLTSVPQGGSLTLHVVQRGEEIQGGSSHAAGRRGCAIDGAQIECGSHGSTFV